MAEAAADNRGEQSSRRCNFLVVAFGIQGHLNPARSLARRLAGIDGVTATLSVQLFGHRRIFPNSSGDEEEIISDGLMSYPPFSDGQDDGSWPTDSEEETARGRWRRSCSVCDARPGPTGVRPGPGFCRPGPVRRLARPYLWVVRREGRSPEVDRLLLLEEAGAEGVVVEWCDQVRVLSHPSVACFVTHCGWNSTLEAVTCGVPVVAAPSWSDQPVNAHLLEEEWGVGVRADRDADGVLTGSELARCVELVVGGGEMAEAIAANVGAWKERAREAMAAGGPSERSLRSFVKMVQELDEFARRGEEIFSSSPSYP
ncbi:unnamed protein product [Alopecurus aequalis]